MGRRSLPPGFRFHPTHVELVMFYLKKKVMRKKLPTGIISVLDIYKYAPWDLPGKSCLRSGDLKWYFFCPRERKYASGARMNRATEFGYWKSTGKDRPVVYNDVDVGKIKTLTFFRGKAPKGDQTDWVMHEYRIEENNMSLRSVAQDAYVLCVIFQKDGPGPRNGAQYGAPFKEEEWDDDGQEEVDALEVGPSVGPSVSSLPLLSKEPQNSFAPDTSATPSNNFGPSSVSCISENFASTSKEIPPIASGSIAPMEIPPLILEYGDDMFTMEDMFPEDENLNLNNGDGFQGTVPTSNNTDEIDIFTGLELEDLVRLSQLSGDGNASVTGHEPIYNPEQMLPDNEAMFSSDQSSFLELNDLNVPLCSTSEVAKYQNMQMSNFNAAYNYSSAIEQPHFPFISFGAANRNVPSFQYPSLHNSNDQICHPTDLGFPDAHMSASSQSAGLQENIHHNSDEGCNGYRSPWCHDHDSNS